MPPAPGDTLLVFEPDVIAHFTVGEPGSDEWEFVMLGEAYVVLDEPREDSLAPILRERLIDFHSWMSVVVLSSTGFIGVLTYPSLTGFRIV